MSEYCQFGTTSLHMACSEGHVNVINVLLVAGANIEAQDKVHPSDLMRQPEFLSVSSFPPAPCL
jgi:ankyrin repeat protein